MATVTIRPLNLRVARLEHSWYVEAFTDDMDRYVHHCLFDTEEQALDLYNRIASRKGCVNLEHWFKVVPGTELEADAEGVSLPADDSDCNTEGRQHCGRCDGTGQFITGVHNGRPVGPPNSPCYRCGGKGYHTEADRRRNYGYDNFAPLKS